MKRVTYLAILTLVAAMASSLPVLAAEGAEGTPSAVVAEPVFDAGELPVGEPITAEFVIRNQGDAPLEIIRVQPDCGCTVASYDETIAPGASGSVRAVVDTTSEVGRNAKAINVFTNDPQNPRIKLTIQSDVKPYLALMPGHARFTSFVHDDRDQTIPQILWTGDFQDLEITKVEIPKDWVDVSYREATDTERSDKGVGKQWRIDVTLSKAAPIGPLADRVLLRTNHPQQKVVEIPISGFVRPMVAVMPSEVNFGKINPADAQQWGILVRNFGSAPLEIRGFDSTVEGIGVAIEALQNGQQYKLILTPTLTMAKGPFKGRVELETSLPQQPKITVELQGEVL
jgi:hypothetical protein